MIKTVVKEAVSKLFYDSKFFKKFQKLKKTQVPLVLYYHRVHEHPNPLNRIPSLSIDISQFEAQIRFLQEKFHVVSLYDVLRHYRSETRLRSDSVAITFDDGFRDNYDLAFPILQKYEIPATIFVTTGFVGKSDLLWWDKLFLQLDLLRNNSLLGYLRGGIDEKLHSAFVKYHQRRSRKMEECIINLLKQRGHSRINEYLYLMDEILAKHGLGYEIPRQFLSWDEIREMIRAGISVGSHTVSHRPLLALDKSTLKFEIDGSKASIEHHTGKSATFFAYPDGVVDFEAKEMVQKSGYLGAFQTKRSTHIPSDDPYALGRIPIKEHHSHGPDGTFSEGIFSLELAGTYERLFLRAWRGKSPYDFSRTT